MASALLIARLHELTGEPCRVEFEDEAERFGVWLEGQDEPELVGSGETEDEALEDAIAVAEQWKANEGRPSHPRSRFE